MFIVPVGIDNTKLNRVPWVTISVIAICVLVWLFGSMRAEKNMVRATRKVMSYAFNHPYLDIPEEFTNFLTRHKMISMFHLAEQLRAEMTDDEEDFYPPTQEQFQREQEQFQAMAEELLIKYRRSFYEKWGLIPAEFHVHSLFTAMFVHAGFMHLFGNMIFLFFTAPFLEDRWGRPFFTAFFLAAGILGGILFMITAPAFHMPMVGASGAIAGVLGAFLIKFTRRKFNFLIFGILYFRAFHFEFSLPAWVVVSLFILGDVLMLALAGSHSPVAHWAHIGGFTTGIGTALILKLTRLEPRLNPGGFDPDYPEFNLDEGVEYLEVRGEHEKALTMLGKAERNEPEIQNKYWEIALKHRDLSHMKKAAIPLFTHALKDSQRQQALYYWLVFMENKSILPIRHSQCLQFLDLLLSGEDSEEAFDALKLYLNQRKHLSSIQIMELGQIAFRIHRGAMDLILESARHCSEISPTQILKLQNMKENAAAPPRTASNPPEILEISSGNVGRLELDGIPREHEMNGPVTSEVDTKDACPLSPEPIEPERREIKPPDVFFCIPTELSSTHLEIMLPSKKRITMKLNTFKVLALAGIKHPDQTNSLILGMLFNAPHKFPVPHRLLIVRSQDFNPSSLFPETHNPMQGFLRLARIIYSGGAPKLWPEDRILEGKGIKFVSSEKDFALNIVNSL
jgi:membrane associated rhomboid family serine protease